MKRIYLLLYSIGIIIIILIIKNLTVSILNLKEKSTIVASLENELKSKKYDNSYLKEKLLYVKTSDFIKNEARNKLGLVQKGEYIVIPPPVNNKQFNQTKERANWRKWWDLFF